jgi:hypothetical protein
LVIFNAGGCTNEHESAKAPWLLKRTVQRDTATK